jgi:trk system potassium uptake protein TrkH
MNYKMIGRFIARILGLEAAFMIPSVFLALWDKEADVAASFLITMALLVFLCIALYVLCRQAAVQFYAREGLICVGMSWIVMSLIGCLPFYLSGQIPNYIDALFEIVSGFTTTGASILPAPESLSRAILYWRSFSHWLGGMGVLVFLLAISSNSDGKSGFTLHLLRAESPGPSVGKLVPRMKQTASILYRLYIILTVLNIAFLLAGGMPWFDSLCTAFGTAGTGGFGIKNDSIAGYSPYLQNVCTVFMLLFGVNFNIYYLLRLRKIREVLRDEELHVYLGFVAGSVLLIAWNIRGMYGTLEETFRHAAFQVSSIITTTGFATTDFDLWPSFSKAILLGLMVVGACAGSTGGGIKCARILLLFKTLKRNIRKTLFPQRVQVIRVNDQVIQESVLDNTNAYLAAYLIIVVVSFTLISIDGFSTGTNLSAVFACFNNIGPGLEAVGPTKNYAAYSAFSKIILILDMLAGRLEIFPVLTLFVPETWKRK